MPIDTAIPSGKASIRKLSDERLFFTALARHHVMAVVIGFGRTYYLRAFIPPPEFIKPATPLVHLHGMLFSAWIVLFMVQTSLVAAGRRDLHMKLGLAGLPLVLSMIVVGDLGGSATDRATGHSAGSAIVAGRADAGGRGLGWLFFCALALRRRPAAHKRLMVLGMAAMIGAAFARMPGMPFMLGAFFLPNIYTVALIFWDVVQTRRPHLSSVLGGLLVLFVTVGPCSSGRARPGWRSPDGWLAFSSPRPIVSIHD